MSHFDSPDNHRDRQLGAALKALTEPPTPDGFWDELSDRLAELDGETAHSSEEKNANVINFDIWRHNRNRVLLVAAVAAIGLLGGLALANPFGSDDPTSIQATDDDQSESDDAGPTLETDEGPTDNETPVDELDYSAPYEAREMFPGASIVAAEPYTDSLLLSFLDPDGTGCEGAGRYVLVARSSSASPEEMTSDPELTGFNYVVQNNQNRLILGTQCEEFVEIQKVASFQGPGEVLIEQDLESPFDVADVAFVGRPVWAADGDRIHLNASTDNGGRLLITYDANTGSIIDNRTVDGALLAELAEGVEVNQTDDGFDVGGMSIPLANDDGGVYIETAVSLDQTMVAAWSNGDLVVVDSAGDLLVEVRGEDETADAAWTADGRLVTVSAVDPDLVVWTPGGGEEPVVVDVELGTEGWTSVAVTDDGRVIAVSGSVFEQGYTLRFG